MSSIKSFFCVVSLLTLIAGVPQAGASDVVSGVVKPKVTIIKPTLVGQDSMEHAQADGHEGHGVASSGARDGSPTIEDYRLPDNYSTPYAITSDSKGIIWFTEMSKHSVARLDPATGELKEYQLPSTLGLPDPEWDYDPKSKLTTPQSYDVYSVGNPGALTVDKNDVIWFVTVLGNSVVRFDPIKEEFTEYMIPTEHSQPYDVAVDSKGLVWFVEKNTGKFGYLNVQEQIKKEISVGDGADLMGIAIDDRDKVWIGDVNGNYLGRYDPDSKKIRVYPITVPVSQPGQMRFDSKGHLWVCNLHSQELGVLIFDKANKRDPEKGIYASVPLPGYNAVPQALAPDKEGRIWIVDSMTNQVGYYDSEKLRWKLFEIPTANSQPMGITVDLKGDVWFTQSDRHANKISRLIVSSIKAEQAPTSIGHEKKSAASAKGGSRGVVALISLAFTALVVVGVGVYLYINAKS
ncbi:MAG: hypothetical protein OEY50_04950 [Nitrospinota bacterium]|nr:hypothetical protein [Nitrospinota bacterium]MDH5676983.1 hypothetical protein [Nitrospinota bacterium]MDH5755200.1 hypothetical protein [Nitrospinota bacterium]